jgi:hypothetical protein
MTFIFFSGITASLKKLYFKSLIKPTDRSLFCRICFRKSLKSIRKIFILFLKTTKAQNTNASLLDADNYVNDVSLNFYFFYRFKKKH